MIISRDLLDKIKQFITRREYLAITGPRQSGKTVFLHILQDYLKNTLHIENQFIKSVTFEDRKLLRQFEDEPVSFVQSYFPESENQQKYFMIDEFQYAEQGGQRLKLIYDTVKNIKIIITGSSSLEINAQIGKYLVGRILTFSIYPFNFREFLRSRNHRLERIYTQQQKKFRSLINNPKTSWIDSQDTFYKEMIQEHQEYCIWGGYPAVVLSKTQKEKQKILGDIYNNYILKDIKGLLELATEKNLLTLSQYLSAQIGNIIVYLNLGQAGDFNYRQLKKHLRILEETFIIKEIRPFFKNRQKELSKNPKIFFSDLGFRNSLIENTGPLNLRPDSGPIVENSSFIALSHLTQEQGKINFWRTKAGAEVDFVLQFQGNIIPIEIKYSVFKSPKISRSLVNFVDYFDINKAIIMTKNFWGKETRGKTDFFFMPVYYM